MKKTAVVFPGVGYTKDRPLLYYAGKLAAANGYELIHLDFSGIDWSKEKLKDKEFLLKTLEYCLDKTDEKQKSIDFDDPTPFSYWLQPDCQNTGTDGTRWACHPNGLSWETGSD